MAFRSVRPTAGPLAKGDRVGDQALAAGVAAFIAAFVPVFGEYIAVPAAVIGIVLGLVGLRLFETGRAVRVAPAAAGLVLSVLAGLTVVVVLVATHAGPPETPSPTAQSLTVLHSAPTL